MRTWAIVVAAGGGTRFGAAKQFARLGDTTVIDRAVGVAQDACDGVVVVLPADSAWVPPAQVRRLPTAAPHVPIRCGPDSRWCPTTRQVIVVHDAARPLASRHLFDQVVQAVTAGADGAVPALPVTDTMKRVEAGRIVETVSRDGLVGVQTPQAFRADVLRTVHRSGRVDTDDAALVETGGGVVVVVDGEPRNIKLTVADDLELVRALLDGART